jgi:hypothetical protein
MSSTFHCPACGGEMHPNARRCPHCGVIVEGDWDNSAHDEEEYDYEDFVSREFGTGPKPPGIPLFWWIAGIILLIAFALAAVGGL